MFIRPSDTGLVLTSAAVSGALVHVKRPYSAILALQHACPASECQVDPLQCGEPRQAPGYEIAVRAYTLDAYTCAGSARLGDCVSDQLPEAQRSVPGSGMDIAALSASAYDDLRRLARARLRSSGPLTLLDTAGLVSDTYRRLAVQHNLRIENRGHVLAYCSRIMRSVIIDTHRAARPAKDADAAAMSGFAMESVRIQASPDAIFYE